jgi:hypothetical protein
VSETLSQYSTTTDFRPGHTLGQEIEADFTKKAIECGLSDEEAKNGFNQNMLSTGLLADGPLEYADMFQRRWLVTAYDAGDVVLHSPFAVRTGPQRTFDHVLIENCRFMLRQSITTQTISFE